MKPLIVSAPPHIRSQESTAHILGDVLIALAPALIVAVGYFGWRAMALAAVCVGSALLSEYGVRRLLRRRNTLGDGTTAVTGLLLAFCLPATFPLPMAALGSVFAIVVVKQMFGGVGQNFVNPALTAYLFLRSVFPSSMAASVPTAVADTVSSATPLAILGGADGKLPEFSEMLLGLHGGALGEVCAVALLLGGLYLLLRRVISPIIPLCCLGSVAACMLIYGHGSFSFVAYELLSGGLLLAAFFMATDPTTSPMTPWGKVLYGIGCGLLTALLRLRGGAEGVAAAILFMNLWTPVIERLTIPRAFGAGKKGGRA